MLPEAGQGETGILTPPTAARPSSGTERNQGNIRRVGSMLAVLATIVVFFWVLRPPLDYDLWFDMRLGQYILGTHTIPHHTLFINHPHTFARPYWMDDEWGFGVLVYSVWRIFGNTGLALLKSTLITGILVVLFLSCAGEPDPVADPVPAPGSREAPPNNTESLHVIASLAMTWLAMLVMRSRFMLRPQLLTDIALALLVMLLLRRERGRRTGLPWTLLLLFVAWANVHAGVAAGVVLLGIWTTGEALQEIWDAARQHRPWREAVRNGWDAARALAGLTVCSGLAALCTPGGWHLIGYLELTFQHTRAVKYIVEWAPLAPRDLLGSAGVLLALEAGAVIVALGNRRMRLSHVLVVGAFTVLAVRHNRSLGELAAVVPPLIFIPLHELFLRSASRAGSRIRRGAEALVFLALASALVIAVYTPGRFNFHPPRAVLPVGAADYLEAHPPHGAVFNSYHFGGYLAWRHIPPFIDGMTQNFSDSLFDTYLDILADDRDRGALLQRYDIGACVLAWPI